MEIPVAICLEMSSFTSPTLRWANLLCHSVKSTGHVLTKPAKSVETTAFPSKKALFRLLTVAVKWSCLFNLKYILLENIFIFQPFLLDKYKTDSRFEAKAGTCKTLSNSIRRHLFPLMTGSNCTEPNPAEYTNWPFANWMGVTC